jgi:hypothetical protein
MNVNEKNNGGKMKKIISLLVIIMSIMLLVSCDKNTVTNKRISINNNSAELSGRVKLFPDGTLISINGVDGQKKSTFKSRSEDFVLMLRAEVDAPTIGSSVLRATHVAIYENYAFVTYNMEGSDYKGGVDVFDISDVSHPVILSEALFNDTDVSSVAFDNENVYLAEATNVDLNNFQTPAVLERLGFENGLLTDDSQRKDLPGYVSTDVKVDDGNVYVSTGNLGGLSILAKNPFEITTNIDFEDARSIVQTDDKLLVLQGTPARLRIYSKNDGSLLQSISVGGANIPESKSSMDVVGDFAFIATGTEGMKIVDINSGNIIAQIAAPVVPEDADDPLDYVTNGVTLNNDLMLIANGAAGVYVAQYDQSNPVDFNLIGSMDFDSSTNFVEGKNNVIFVATGFGGFKILEVVPYSPEDANFLTLGTWTDTGCPEYFEENQMEISEELLAKIHATVPEHHSLPENHPEFLTGLDTSLKLTVDSEVKLAFISEGAGYKNILGYYYYDADNVPTSVDDLDNMTVVFPNCSAQGSGGDLQTGDTVLLKTSDGGTMFPANTVIGFFLVSNGWSNGQVTTGYYTQYSNPEFNENQSQFFQQNVIFHDSDNLNMNVLVFEDIRLPGGDKDFNDAVFGIQTTPENAVDLENIPNLLVP